VVDLSLVARSPLAHLMKPGIFGTAVPQAGVTLSAVKSLTLASMITRRGRKSALVATVRDRFKADLPLSPRRVEAGALAFIWTGPNQWLVVGRGAGLIEPQLEILSPLAAICDQSDSRAIVSVSGPSARHALAKGITVDLHPRSFKANDCAVTMIGHIGACLWQADEIPTYHIAVFRSLAESFWGWLTESSAQYGYYVDASE
jgi:heterotetrameric sarcosine oxidase gamma subunit